MAGTRPENVRLRLPTGLDAHLRQLADEQGVPLNTLLTVLLTQASGWSPVPKPEGETDAERLLRQIREDAQETPS